MGRRRSNRNVRLCKLNEGFDGLDSIKRLRDVCNVDVRISAKDRKKLTETRDESLRLSRTWRKDPVEEDKIYQIKVPDIQNKKNTKFIKFMHRAVNVERQHNQIWKNKAHTQLLPREEFVFNELTDVLFIDIDDVIYMAVFTSDEARFEQIYDFVGSDNIEDEDTLTEDFFAWVFWKYDRNNRKINADISLPSLNAFSGTIQSNDLNDFISGKSPNVADLSVLKMHIARQFPLRSIGFELMERENKLYFKMDIQNQLVVDTRRSVIASDGIMNRVLVDVKEYTLVVYIYSYIIPLLTSIYESESSAFSGQLDDYRADLAKGIVHDLIGATRIKLQDLTK